LSLEPKNTDDFVSSGGNSLKALVFINCLEEYLQKSLKINRVLDALFKKSFSDLVSFIELDLEQQSNVDQTVSVSKRFKQANQNNELKNASEFIENNEIIGYISKFENNILKSNHFSKKILNLSIKWKFNTNKCVDATPLVLETFDNKEIILIGSHSNKFFCIDNNGNLIWEFKSQDRIESSAIISSCRRFIIYGSYDHYLYVLKVKDGSLEWKFKTDDIIKSSPCVNRTGHVYFGSYDKHLYCLNINVKQLVWKINLDDSSLFSGPIILNENQLLVTTLGGSLFALNCLDNGNIEWKLEFNRPIFTSPIVNKMNANIFFGTCEGKFHCLNNREIVSIVQ